MLVDILDFGLICKLCDSILKEAFAKIAKKCMIIGHMLLQIAKVVNLKADNLLIALQ